MQVRSNTSPELDRLARDRRALATVAAAVDGAFRRKPMPAIAAAVLGQVLDHVDALDEALHTRGTPALFTTPRQVRTKGPK
jgi:hypothetical protein